MRFIIFFTLFIQIHARGIIRSQSDSAPHSEFIRRSEILDEAGKYLVDWKVNLTAKIVTFELTVESNGFIGFGLSPTGGMKGADIVIGGIFPNGTIYFQDRHGIGNQEPVVDPVQDYELLEAKENSTHTVLKFSRVLDTCDVNDIRISNDSINLIWSYGATDLITYHGENRGTHAALLLDPPMPPFDPSTFKTWPIIANTKMPTHHTTYWCTTHRSPPLDSKQHIVGFEAVQNSPEARRYTHHFVLRKCKAPDGVDPDEFFGPLVGGPGGDCFANHVDAKEEYCQTYLFVWAVGGKRVIFPDHVGYPFGETGHSEYFMVEMHYDNPNGVDIPMFETGLQIFYTSELREFDAGTITGGHDVAFGQTVPPNSDNFVIVGHCSSDCTQNNFPADGLNVFNVLLHAHLAGRKLRLRHFRNGEELPWMANDDNYSFDYQQNRLLRNEVKFLPGDHLSYECHYSTKGKSNVTIGGLTTNDEMCQSFLWYYPKIDLEICASGYPNKKAMEYFGIHEIEMMTGSRDPLVLAPQKYANRTYSQVLDTFMDWTDASKTNLQKALRYEPHNDYCISNANWEKVAATEFNEFPPVSYPPFRDEYKPPNECSGM